MGEEEKLLAAVRRDPEDDTPRLAYADWLDEHAGEIPGREPQEMQDRARLIRIQVALANGRNPEDNKPLGPARKAELERDAGKLLAGHRQEWDAPLRDSDARHVEWKRGFPNRIEVDAGTFLDNADRIFAAAPITELQITNLREVGAQALTTCPHLSKLARLDLTLNDIGDEGARVLAASPSLGNLTRLNLSWNGIGDNGTQSLAASPHFRNLRFLNLSCNGIGDEGARALAASTHLGNLTDFDLSSNALGTHGARAIFDSTTLATQAKRSALESVRFDTLARHVRDQGAGKGPSPPV